MLPAIKAKAEFHVGNPSLLSTAYTERGNCCCCFFLEAMPSPKALLMPRLVIANSQTQLHVTARDVFRIKDIVRESVYSK